MNDTLKARSGTRRIVDGAWATRIAAILLAIAGIALLWWSFAGVILVVTGLALVLLSRPATEATEISHAGLLKDLGLHGPGHHVPTADGVRLFIPASARGPYLIPELEGAVHRDPPGSIGLAMDPPGRALLQRWADMDGLPSGQGPEEAAQHLLRALPKLGVARGVRVAEGPTGLRLEMRLRNPQPARDAEATGWHMQGGCAAQSFACGITALAMAAPIQVKSSRIDNDDRLHLEVVVGKNA